MLTQVQYAMHVLSSKGKRDMKHQEAKPHPVIKLIIIIYVMN